MTSPPLAVPDDRFHRFSRAVAITAISVGILVLVGWVFHISILTSVFPGLEAMKPSAAIGLGATGMALWFAVPNSRRAGRLIAAFVVILGFVGLAQRLAGIDLRFDSLLVGSSSTGSTSPPRMAPASATCFILLGLALLFLDAPTVWGRVPAHAPALVAALMALVTLAGYAYGADALYRVGAYFSMALHTALVLFLLTLGVLAARPRRGVVAVAASGTAGGLVLRRQLPMAGAILLALGWACLAGGRAGHYDAAFGLALMAVSAGALFTAIAIWTGLTVHRLDLRLRDAERDAGERAELLRATLTSIGDGVVATDVQGRVVFLNAVAETLTGWTQLEAAGQPLGQILAIMNAHTRLPVTNPAEQALADGTVVGLANHTILVARDGTERPIADCAAPIRTTGDALSGAVLVFRDVTEQYAAEEALHRERTVLRTLIDSLPDAIWTKDALARFVVGNRAHIELVRAGSEAEVAGKTGFELHPPELAGAYHEDDLRVLDHGETVLNREELIRDATGRERWYLVTKTPLRDRAGNVIGLVGIARNIQERKEAEEELRSGRELLRAVMGSVPDAVITTDERGIVRSANTAAERMFGSSAGVLTGRDVRELVPDVFGDEMTGRRTACEPGREIEARRQNGSAFPAELSVTEFRLENARHFTVVVRDVTAHKKLEDQLRHAQKMEAVGRLAGGVAHDFNNLLTVINGFSEVLLDELPHPNTNRPAVEAIREAGARAAELTRQLLTFSRKAIVEPKVLDINEVVAQSAKLLKRLIGEDVTLTTILAPDLARVKADLSQIEQAVVNLAVNARDAMPDGGQLTIETCNVRLRSEDVVAYPDLAPGDYVRLAISDTGMGMTDEVRAKIFEPFFTTKEPGKGTGLGLAMVYGAVQSHGGHISVYSEVGVGSTFKILLPVTTETRTSRETGEAPLAERGTETLLLAEDEEGVRRLSRFVLESHGYTVFEAASGLEAVALAASHPGRIHLMVTDVVMPEMGGREAAEAIRAQRPDLKVLFMSGYTEDAVILHGIVEATDAFLQKPFTPLTLARKVRAILDAAG